MQATSTSNTEKKGRKMSLFIPQSFRDESFAFPMRHLFPMLASFQDADYGLFRQLWRGEEHGDPFGQLFSSGRWCFDEKDQRYHLRLQLPPGISSVNDINVETHADSGTLSISANNEHRSETGSSSTSYRETTTLPSRSDLSSLRANLFPSSYSRSQLDLTIKAPPPPSSTEQRHNGKAMHPTSIPVQVQHITSSSRESDKGKKHHKHHKKERKVRK